MDWLRKFLQNPHRPTKGEKPDTTVAIRALRTKRHRPKAEDLGKELVARPML